MSDHRAPHAHPGHDGERQRWLDRPGNVDKVVYALYAVCAALFAIDFFFHKHAHFAFENWLGFYGLFGLIGSVTLVMLAKGLRKIIIRPEDYYESETASSSEDADA